MDDDYFGNLHFDGGYGNRGYNRNNQRGGYQNNYRSLMDDDENDFSSADSYERKPRFNENRNFNNNRNSYSDRREPRTDNIFDEDRSERSNQRSYDRKPRRNYEGQSNNTDLYDTVLSNLNKRD